MTLTSPQHRLLQRIADAGWLHHLDSGESRASRALFDRGFIAWMPGNPPALCLTPAGRAYLEADRVVARVDELRKGVS